MPREIDEVKRRLDSLPSSMLRYELCEKHALDDPRAYLRYLREEEENLLINRIQTVLGGDEDLNLHIKNVGDARNVVPATVDSRKNTVIIVDDEMAQLLTEKRFLRPTLLETLIGAKEGKRDSGKILFVAQTEAILERIGGRRGGGPARVIYDRDLLRNNHRKSGNWYQSCALFPSAEG